MNPSYGRLFEEWEIAIAKKVVQEFKRKWKHLAKEDPDDLLQECLAHWVFVKSKRVFEDDGFKRSFFRRVVKNKLMDLVREAETHKRKTLHESVSLDAPLGEEEGASSLLDQLSEVKAGPASEVQNARLRMDLAAALEKLSPRQKELCRLMLEEGLSVNEASKRFKTYRSEIYREVERIRRIFEREGLKGYLGRSASGSVKKTKN